MLNKLFLEIVATITIILFLYTGISKLFDYDIFKEQLAIVPILSTIYPVVALATPVAEIIIAALLFWPAWRIKGLYAALISMTVFTIYIVYLLMLDTELPCSCGGIIEFLSWKQHLLFNIGLIILLTISIRIQNKLSAVRPSVSIL